MCLSCISPFSANLNQQLCVYTEKLTDHRDGITRIRQIKMHGLSWLKHNSESGSKMFELMCEMNSFRLLIIIKSGKLQAGHVVNLVRELLITVSVQSNQFSFRCNRDERSFIGKR